MYDKLFPKADLSLKTPSPSPIPGESIVPASYATGTSGAVFNPPTFGQSLMNEPFMGAGTPAAESTFTPFAVDSSLAPVGGTATEAGVAKTGASTFSTAAPYLGVAGGASLAGNLSTGVKEIGDVATLGKTFGGENERNIAGGTLAGAATGAALGSTIFPGVGTAVGAGLGAGAGALSSGVGSSIAEEVKKATWLCTEVGKHIGLTAEDNSLLSILRRYSIKYHNGWMRAYWNEGSKLVEAIKDQEQEVTPFYKELKIKMVVPVLNLVRAGELEEAFNLYKDATVELFQEYAPKVEIKEAN
jgi:hypothetical protein